MKKFKVMTVLGTRPEIIRLSRVMSKLDEHCEQILVHTGQNYDYELNQVFFNDLGVRQPDYFLNANGTPAETIGNVIIELDKLLEDIVPEALLILGDTDSCLAAIPAKRRKIPVFHMEAGNRCFDMRVPEEINRRIVDHTADINLTYSSIAREYLLREGLNPAQVVKTGSPLYEVINYYMTEIKASEILQKLVLQKHNYFLVSAHRAENVDSKERLTDLVDTLNAIAEKYSLPVIVSTHPRTRKQIEKYGFILNPLIQTLKPFGFHDYMCLQINSKVVLSDSGTISEDSSILNFPAVNIREAHERPEAFEEASVMMVGLHKTRVMQALQILEQQPRDAERLLMPVADYSNPNVSDKVLRIIISYTDYVNRVVWKKY
jgi:UDP-N-acetylglucosamine 2-epimerase (non-hydrolysing)